MTHYFARCSHVDGLCADLISDYALDTFECSYHHMPCERIIHWLTSDFRTGIFHSACFDNRILFTTMATTTTPKTIVEIIFYWPWALWAAWVTSESSQNRASHGPSALSVVTDTLSNDSIFLVSAPACRSDASADWLNFLFDIAAWAISHQHISARIGRENVLARLCNVCIFAPMSAPNLLKAVRCCWCFASNARMFASFIITSRSENPICTQQRQIENGIDVSAIFTRSIFGNVVAH